MSKKENEAHVGPLLKSEFDLLIKLAKKVLWSDLETREAIQQHKLNITPVNFYSNIPSVAEVRESFEYRDTEEQTGSYFSETIFSREIFFGTLDFVNVKLTIVSTGLRLK